MQILHNCNPTLVQCEMYVNTFMYTQLLQQLCLDLTHWQNPLYFTLSATPSPSVFHQSRPEVATRSSVELITFEILAAERLRLMGFDNRLIIDCFANIVNILIWLFSTNDGLRSAKYESNYLENPFPEMKGVNLLSKTHRNDKSNLKPKTVLQE